MVESCFHKTCPTTHRPFLTIFVLLIVYFYLKGGIVLTRFRSSIETVQNKSITWGRTRLTHERISVYYCFQVHWLFGGIPYFNVLFPKFSRRWIYVLSSTEKKKKGTAPSGMYCIYFFFPLVDFLSSSSLFLSLSSLQGENQITHCVVIRIDFSRVQCSYLTIEGE